MNITTFIASLADVEYTADTIVSDIISNMENLEKVVIPALTTLSQIENDKKVPSKAAKPYTTYAMKYIDNSKKNISTTLLALIPNIQSNLKHLSKEYSKIFSGKSVFTSGLTVKKGAFIAELSMCHNFVVFTMDLADILGRAYGDSVSDKKTSIYDIEAYETKRLNDGIANYVYLVNHLSMDKKKFKSNLEKQLDIVIDESNASYAGSDENDIPVSVNFVGNPLYHVGKSIVEYQAKRYKSLLAKRRSLEMYLIDIENSKDGKNNAAVEKEIEYTRKRIQVLDMDIDKLEDS